MPYRLKGVIPSSFFDLIRYPVTDPLCFKIHRSTGIVTMDPMIAKLLDLPSDVMADGGKCLGERILDESDRELCRESLQSLFDNKCTHFSHYARVKIFGKLFWIRVDAELASSHKSSRLIKGSIIVYNLHRILYELLGQCDCGKRNRKTLMAFAEITFDCEAALLEFTEMTCEPKKLCRHLKNELRSSDVIFAKPLYDGSILVAFKGDREDFVRNLAALHQYGDFNAERSFFAGKSTEFTEALEYRGKFLDKLSERIPVHSGLTVHENVMLALTIRHNFAGLKLFFQPQVGANGFMGGEFLVRLSSQFSRITVSPDRFIPVLEKTDLIKPFGRWVVETVLEEARVLADDMAKPGFKVSFNMSASQCDDDGFVPYVAHCIERFNFPARCLMVELTETAKPLRDSHLKDQINGLRELGVQTAIDDFGSGFNSIETLFDMPYDLVKFSRKFVVSSLEDQKRLSFFKALISACHDTGVSICAEGVEDEEMHKKLEELGVDFFQGYHYAKPMPIKEAVQAVNECATVNTANKDVIPTK